MSCHEAQTEASRHALDHDSSDYGSDFTVDEEELLNELLARAVATEQTTTTTATAIEDLATPPPQAAIVIAEDLSDLKPLQEPLLVTDIEDYEIPHAVRVPKVLGREAWSPTNKRVWQPSSQQQHLSSPVAGNVGSAISVEHPNSTEGRQRELEKQQAREEGWAEAKGTLDRPDSPGAVLSEQRPPLERFRKPPNKSLSVSDLIAPAWCELQYWYTLTKHGRKRRTPAMKQGSAVHKVLEEEVHTTVPIEVTTKEDGWALRIWNVIQGLRTLREFGITRELEVWGLVEGEIVTGVIDQLSYVCPDRGLEASAATYYADAQSARAALPEYQMSITEYLLSPSRQGKTLDQLRWKDEVAESAVGANGDSAGLDQPSLDSPRVYITDIKTRASRSIPTVSSSSFRPTHLQLQLYYHMLNKLVTSDELSIHTIANRYDLDPERVFTDAFIAEIGGLNDQFFDTMSSQTSDPDYYPGASQDSMSILLAHNNLASLWSLMKEQVRRTFLPIASNPSMSPSIPARSQPAFLEEYPTILSPLLTAKYLSSTDADDGVPHELGSRSFLFDPVDLTSYVSDEMKWWRGDRAPRGVEVLDAWKCRICEFRDECEWRQSKERELATRRRRLSKKTAMEMLGASTN